MKTSDLILQGLHGSDWPLPTDAPFTYATARAAGLTRHAIRMLVNRGHLLRPIQGVYVDAGVPDSPALRAACLRLVVPEDCVVVDRHAGWLLGAEMVLAPGEHVALRPLTIYRPSGCGRLRNGLSASGERWLRDEDITEVDGVRVTTPLRTAHDLGRVRWPDEAIAGMDALARLGAFTIEELVAGVEQFRGHRWVRTLRLIAPLVDGRSESPPESILRLRCHETRLPMTPQLEVCTTRGLLARLDLGDEPRRGGAEYDGAEWHSSPDQLQHDRDRRCELAEDGWIVEAFTKDDLFGSSRTVDARLIQLRHLLERRLRAAG